MSRASATRGVNLSRIESRPTGEQLGTYVFFLDCTGHVAEPAMGEALAALHRLIDQGDDDALATGGARVVDLTQPLSERTPLIRLPGLSWVDW